MLDRILSKGSSFFPSLFYCDNDLYSRKAACASDFIEVFGEIIV